MFLFCTFEGVHAQVADFWSAQFGEGILPDFESFFFLFEEGHLPVAVAKGGDAAVIGPVDELLARPFAFAPESGAEVVAVEVDLVGHVADLAAFAEFFLGGRVAGGGDECGEHVLVGADVIDDGAGFDRAGPADEGGHAVAAFPLGVFLTAEHRGATIGPGEGFGAVVGRVHDDRVVIDAELLEFVEHHADMAVVFHHAVGINAEARLAFRLRLEVGEDVHAG